MMTKSGFGQFSCDEGGSVTAFTALSFLLMVVSAGMAVDFMRHEAHRAELQDAVDRGLLAAASLSQTRPAEDTIRGYLNTTSFVRQGYDIDVDVQQSLNSRTVDATVSFDIDTFFLKIIGITSMPIEVTGSAQEAKQDVELSLVLDVSTSMSSCTATVPAAEIGPGVTEDLESTCDHWTGIPSGRDSRLAVMKSAATGFIDQILTDDTQEYVSVNLIPFAGQVDPGSTVFSQLRSSKVQNYSHCIEFTSNDYNTTTAPSYRSRSQGQYFSLSSYYTYANLDPTVALGWCPHKTSNEEILYHSNNATALKTRIQNLETHEATGTQYGMKWGTMLLDPSSSYLTTALIGSGEVSSEFSDRPAAYSDNDTLKFVVIMSDGNTTSQRRAPSYYYDTSGERAWWANDNNAGYGWRYTHESLSADTARQQLISTCTKAKEKGIVVFTIGFDVEDGSFAEQDMAACATSSGHFYDVKGLELSSAFSAIAATIQKLKLVN